MFVYIVPESGGFNLHKGPLLALLLIHTAMSLLLFLTVTILCGTVCYVTQVPSTPAVPATTPAPATSLPLASTTPPPTTANVTVTHWLELQ